MTGLIDRDPIGHSHCLHDLIIVGASWGIGKIGVAAVESIARQPEMGDNIRMAMLIAAAFIEGVTFFALIICLLALFLQFLP